MKSQQVTWALAILGAALTVAGLLLPLWSKNGVGISGMQGSFLSFGRWVLLGAAIAALLVAFVRQLRKPMWMALPGLVIALQSSLILWKGYKLGAIGFGVWVLFLAAVVILVNADLLRRNQRS